MQIILNGEPYALKQARTIATLLAELQQAHRRVAVEHNREIIPRSQYDSVCLAEGDHIEIVQAIGGG